MTLCELKGKKCIGDRGRDKVFRWTDDSFLIGIQGLIPSSSIREYYNSLLDSYLINP